MRERELQKKNCDGDLVFNTGNQEKGSFDSFICARVFPRENMATEKLQHLITKLGQKLLRAGVFGKSEKRGTRPLVVENHYQRTELPAKGDGQWILFRWSNHSFVNVFIIEFKTRPFFYGAEEETMSRIVLSWSFCIETNPGVSII